MQNRVVFFKSRQSAWEQDMSKKKERKSIFYNFVDYQKASLKNTDHIRIFHIQKIESFALLITRP